MTLTNEDNMVLMARYPDKYFDLAIVDPPYGIGMDGGNIGYKGKNNFEKKDWDKEIPPPEYFIELKRVSKNQIIWGGNYFSLEASRCWIVWDKGEGFYNRTYAECELAWTSFDQNTIKFKRDPLAKGDYRGKIHPCQKPISLYKFLLMRFGKQNDKIIDTHLGGAGIAIALHQLNESDKMNFSLVACDADADYFKESIKRIKKFTTQKEIVFQK